MLHSVKIVTCGTYILDFDDGAGIPEFMQTLWKDQ